MGSDYTTLDPRRRTGDPFGGTVIFNRLTPAIDPLTERARAIWTAGDYDRIAGGFRHEARAFVERLSLTPEQTVLDAACGSGNLTIPAARTGARVTGFDLVSPLLDAAAKWAAREGLEVRLDQGTVEKMPYADAEFDAVLSMFGVMFAPRPDRVVAELARVTRPGGRVALANWTRQGFIGRLLATHVAYVPPPSGMFSPLLWGDESVIRERFDERVWDVSTTLRTLTFRYPQTPAGTADLFRTSYGPTVRTFEALASERRGLLEADLTDLWELHQRPGVEEGTEVDSEYLEVIAVRR
jgi:SAM-dependent methyltransferase